jgi:hypothetical protein
MNVQGGSPLSSKIEDSNKLWNHNMEIIAGGTAPNILGVDFWTEHKANFCLANKEITLTHLGGELVRIPVSVHKPDEAVRIAAVSAENYGSESKAKAAHARVAGKLRAAIGVKATARVGCNEAVEEPVYKRIATAEISRRCESVATEQQQGQVIRLTDQISIPPREPVMIEMQASGAGRGLHK